MTQVAPEQLTVAEIDYTIGLYQLQQAERLQAVEQARIPYREAEDFVKEAQEMLRQRGAALSEAEQSLHRVEDTIRKLEQLKHATRGGLLFAPEAGGKTKRLWKFRWVDDAVEVLQREQRFLSVDTLVDLIMRAHPEYAKAGVPSVHSKGREHLLAAAEREGNTTGRGRKKMLTLWSDHIGLHAWLMDSGRPDPKYFNLKIA